MAGNVDEWVEDAPRLYRAGTCVDPVGYPFGREAVIRGGSWHDQGDAMRVTRRAWSSRNMSSGGSRGFRIALDAR